jgi:hypothetical protein
MDPQQGWMQSLFAKQAPQGLLGSGMAQSAAQMIQSRPYQLHVQEARALGQQPMTPEQFMRQMQQQQMQPRPGLL